MTRTMKCKRFHFLCLLLCFVLSLGAEESQKNWVLSAAPFSGGSDLSELLPSLILSSFPDNLERTIDDAEQRDRQIEKIRNERSSLLANLTALNDKRDAVVLQNIRQWEKNEKIKELEAQIAQSRQKIDENLAFTELETFETVENLREPIVLYQNAATTLLKEEPDGKTVQAWLQGSILERGNYLYASVTVHRFPGNVLIGSCDSIYPKTEANLLADDIAQKLLNVLVNKDPVTIRLTVGPVENKVTVRLDGVPLVNYSQPITTQAGLHHLTVESEGYVTQNFSYDFSDAAEYTVQVAMIPLYSVDLSVYAVADADLFTRRSAPDVSDSSVYLMGGFANPTGAAVTINELPVLGEVVTSAGDSTFFVVEQPRKNKNLAVSSLTATGTTVKARTGNTTQLIDKRRRGMYTSFGLFLLTLPVSFYTYGRMGDYAAQIDGQYNQQLNNTTRPLWNGYEKWRTYSVASMSISIAFAGNWLFQLGRYIITANKVLPEIVYPEEIE